MRSHLIGQSWRGPASSTSSAAAKVGRWKRKGSKGDLYHLQAHKLKRWGPLKLSFAAFVLFSLTGFFAAHLWNAGVAEAGKAKGDSPLSMGHKLVSICACASLISILMLLLELQGFPMHAGFGLPTGERVQR